MHGLKRAILEHLQESLKLHVSSFTLEDCISLPNSIFVHFNSRHT